MEEARRANKDNAPNAQSAKQERVKIDDMTFTPIQEENLDGDTLEKQIEELMEADIKENLIKRY